MSVCNELPAQLTLVTELMCKRSHIVSINIYIYIYIFFFATPILPRSVQSSAGIRGNYLSILVVAFCQIIPEDFLIDIRRVKCLISVRASVWASQRGANLRPGSTRSGIWPILYDVQPEKPRPQRIQQSGLLSPSLPKWGAWSLWDREGQVSGLWRGSFFFLD